MTTPKLIIAFTGPKESGKDTAANWLLARNSLVGRAIFQKINFADPLKQMAAILFCLSGEECNDSILKSKILDRFPYRSPRDLLIAMARWARFTYGGEVFVNRWRTSVEEAEDVFGEVIVVTDLRHPEELAELLKQGAAIIYVQNDAAELRLNQAKAAGDRLAIDESEAHYDLMRASAHVTITNNTSIDELHSQVIQKIVPMLPERIRQNIPQAKKEVTQS